MNNRLPAETIVGIRPIPQKYVVDAFAADENMKFIPLTGTPEGLAQMKVDIRSADFSQGGLVQVIPIKGKMGMANVAHLFGLDENKLEIQATHRATFPKLTPQ